MHFADTLDAAVWDILQWVSDKIALSCQRGAPCNGSVSMTESRKDD